MRTAQRHRRPALRIVVLLAAVVAVLGAGEVGLTATGRGGVGARFGGGVAFAANDPPDVRGLSPAAAKQALLAWDKSAVISFAPALADLPPGTDPSTVVALRATRASQPQFAAAASPVVVELGTAVPELTGDTLATATDELARHGLRPAARPVDAAPDWLVNGQEVAPGTLVGFRAPVAVFLVAPVVVTTPPPAAPAPSNGPRIVLVAGSSAGALVLLALLATLALRRTRRRRRPPPLERVEARAHPGQLIGPELIERDPGPGRPGTVGVRLEPRYDPGTFRIEEARR